MVARSLYQTTLHNRHMKGSRFIKNSFDVDQKVTTDKAARLCATLDEGYHVMNCAMRRTICESLARAAVMAMTTAGIWRRRAQPVGIRSAQRCPHPKLKPKIGEPRDDSRDP